MKMKYMVGISNMLVFVLWWQTQRKMRYDDENLFRLELILRNEYDTESKDSKAKNFDFHTVEVLLLFCFFVFVRINETTRELKWSSINKSIWTQLIAYLLTDAEPWLRISRKTAMCRRNEIHNQHALSVWQPENYVCVMVLILYKRRELPNKRASVKYCVTGIR